MAGERKVAVSVKVARAFVVVSAVLLVVAWERAYHTHREPPTWAVILFIPCFITGFLLSSTDVAYRNGWNALAERYRTKSRPKGPTLDHEVTRIGLIQEGGLTRLIVADEGLVLIAVPLFRIGRPALLIPWRDIGWVRERKELWSRVYELDLAGITTIRVRKKAYERMKNFVPAPGLGPPPPPPGTPPPPIE